MPSVAEEAALSHPWQSKPFRNLTMGHATSSFGNAFSPVALAFAVLHLGAVSYTHLDVYKRQPPVTPPGVARITTHPTPGKQ